MEPELLQISSVLLTLFVGRFKSLVFYRELAAPAATRLSMLSHSGEAPRGFPEASQRHSKAFQRLPRGFQETRIASNPLRVTWDLRQALPICRVLQWSGRDRGDLAECTSSFRLQEASRGSKRPSRGFQEASRRLPRGIQEASAFKKLQVASRGSKRLQGGFKRLQEAFKRLQEPIWRTGAKD